MKTAEEILSEISGWHIANFTNPPPIKGMLISPDIAIKAMKEYASQQPSEEEFTTSTVSEERIEELAKKYSGFVHGDESQAPEYQRDVYESQLHFEAGFKAAITELLKR